MRTAMTYRLICHLLHAIPIKVLMTGHLMTIVLNLKLLTSCITAIRCPLGTSILFSTSGLHLLPSTMILLHFQQLPTCTIQLTPLPSVMFPGNLSLCSIMELNLLATFHRGWKLNMTSGFGTRTPWSTTSSLTRISNPILITHPSKSMRLMVSIASKTLCPGIRPGVKQWVPGTIFLILSLCSLFIRT